jgi:hypothetical protein
VTELEKPDMQQYLDKIEWYGKNLMVVELW